MKNEIKHEFIASSKVIRYKLDAKVADVLATLTYKQDYWKKEGKLIHRKGEDYFFISHQDITAETCLSASVIAKCIKELKIKGFVLTIRQGLNKPNLYCVNKKFIETFVDNETPNFKKWQEETREGKYSRKPKESRIIKKDVSGVLNIDEQEVEKIGTTKNKNTKNKKTKNKNLTNQASLVSEIHLGPMLELEKEIELEKVISDLRSDDDSDINERVKFLFKFLCSLVPSFKGFSMSNDDRELLLTILQSEIHDYKLASKIISNTTDIVIRRKESRFGNLFVGIDKMIANHENLCL
jgi:hypothetical protein